ncbi:hypothetical protein OFAG_02240 [Oxalobacter formigenes HOxBLS]|uniref:Uncharacterized protein n=1 Tax=Oxalobacter paraformigenes TaxID=556268 RepID=T5LQJ9_9BURK|nr:hypothetical protein OFAG_02240 [Oxalobacter paraformigenes]
MFSGNNALKNPGEMPAYGGKRAHWPETEVAPGRYALPFQGQRPQTGMRDARKRLSPDRVASDRKGVVLQGARYCFPFVPENRPEPDTKRIARSSPFSGRFFCGPFFSGRFREGGFSHDSGKGADFAKSMTMAMPASAQNAPAPNTDEYPSAVAMTPVTGPVAA